VFDPVGVALEHRADIVYISRAGRTHMEGLIILLVAVVVFAPLAMAAIAVGLVSLLVITVIIRMMKTQQGGDQP